MATVTVQPGDTLAGIASELTMSAADLFAANRGVLGSSSTDPAPGTVLALSDLGPTARADELRAAIARGRVYVGTLERVVAPSPEQAAALATDRATLDAERAELAAIVAPAAPAPVAPAADPLAAAPAPVAAVTDPPADHPGAPGPVIETPAGLLDQLGAFHDAGVFALLPPDTTAAAWLAVAARDTVAYLHQLVYVELHPGAPVGTDFPSEASDTWQRRLAIHDLYVGVVESGQRYYTNEPVVAGDLEAIASYAMWYTANTQDANGEAVHYSDADWTLVGGMARALEEWDPHTLPPGTPGAL